jgi:hypothetical protein
MSVSPYFSDTEKIFKKSTEIPAGTNDYNDRETAAEQSISRSVMFYFFRLPLSRNEL